MTDELEWRPIPSIPGYWAGSGGQIKSSKDRVLKPYVIKGNTPYLAMKVMVIDRRQTKLVSRMVCEAFHGEPPSRKHEAAHQNGKSLDNVPTNLKWATSKENIADKKFHGTYLAGERRPNSKLTEKAVLHIRERHSREMVERRLGGKKNIRRGTIQELSQQFGVAPRIIQYVIKRDRWQTV